MGSSKNTTVVESLESRALMAAVTVNVPASDDAFVRDGASAAANYGQLTSLETKSHSLGYSRESYLMFDTAALTGPAVTKAVLRLYGGLNATGSPVAFGLHGTSTSWDETTLNWNNKPAAAGAALRTGSVSSSTPKWFELDVTSYVAAQKQAGADAVSFAVKATVKTSQVAVFNSGEASANQPQLVVTTDDTVVPPPPPPPGNDGQGIRPSADAHVRNGTYATQNFGQNSLLELKLVGTGYDRESYLQFPIADLGPAANISGVKLRLFGRLQDTRVPSLTIDLMPVSGTWSENTLTWNTRPALGLAPITTKVVAGVTNTWYEFDVTDYVRQQKTVGASSVSFALRVQASAQGLAQFNSDENVSDGPRLVVTQGTVVTPPANPDFPAISPIDASTHGVRVGAGKITLPNGTVVNIAGGLLNIDTPEVSRGHTWDGAAPGAYLNQPASQRWPDNSINLHPKVDTLILGGIYRAIIPSSVVVTDLVTGAVKTRDVHYKLNDDWGQVLNLNNGLGQLNTGSLRIKYDVVKQRMDLIQVWPDGTLSVKKGTSAIVCPTLPTPDSGAVGLAGVFVYTLDGAKGSDFALQQRDILPIKPAAPVQPLNGSSIPKTLAKLRAGSKVNIAYFGDSITEGAEAGNWWSDRSKTYTGLVTSGLQGRFQNLNVTATLASQGGKGATDSQAVFQSRVLDAHNAGNTIDLVVINMGMNDKGKPGMDPFKLALADYVNKARAVGIEVLMVTPMQSNIYYEPNQTDRVSRLEIANAIKDVAATKAVTCIDVYTEWANQATRGIMPFSQLHNGFNHPGVAGMEIYANAMMRAFPLT